MKKVLSLATTILISINLFSQENTDSLKSKVNPIQYVDSIYQNMSLEERAAQLIMIRAHSNLTKEFHRKVENTITNYNVGGLCFFQGGPARQIDLINRYQKVSKHPLLIAIDGEWGPGMRLDSLIDFPRQMTLGAISDDSLIYEMGKEIARQLKLIGVHINFAPVVDVNNNPMNPVINNRSFGENSKSVAAKASMYMKGMQDNGVMACAKHFPGHGDTDRDSHKTLPSISCDSTELRDVHIYPFEKLISENVASVMVAHLNVPAIDNSGIATTLSQKAVKDLLKDELKFEGLVITDALEMKGVTDHFGTAELAVKVIQAGNDILLMPEDIGIAIDAIKNAYLNSKIDTVEFEKSVKKVLLAKYNHQLFNDTVLSKKNIVEKINTKTTKHLIQELYNHSITLVKNKNQTLPLFVDNSIKTAVVNIGGKNQNEFTKIASRYRNINSFSLPRNPQSSQLNKLKDDLNEYEQIIFNYCNTSNSPRYNYGLYQSVIDFITKQDKEKIISVNLGANPYSLKRFEDINSIDALLVSYQDNIYAQRAAAQALFGGIDINGKIPFSSSEEFPAKSGLTLKKSRLKYGFNNIEDSVFKSIDSIALDGIKSGAYPGAQILIAQKGEVIYNKNFGYFTYDKKQLVNDSTIYDLASLTKVLATGFSIMKLVEDNKIDIDKKTGNYLDFTKNTNKDNLLIRDILAHQARLKPWIPFYINTIKNDSIKDYFYCDNPDDYFFREVAYNIYTSKITEDTIKKYLLESDLRRRKRYKYSDLGMYLMKDIIEKQSGVDFESFNKENFYNKLGMDFTLFNPLQVYNQKHITPTENDIIFRKSQIRGYVHDQGAAMMGGVAGHAGLFSNTNDIAKPLQMLLNNGVYGKDTFFLQSTIEEFTRQQFPLIENRRGLCFDKPLPEPSEGGPTCEYVSSSSYGHSGFTGTYFWVDPEHDLIYIFLSNRIYPDAENTKLLRKDIRTNIQAEVYRALNLIEKN